MESLQGYFLIATPRMPDPRFAEKVVFICAHNEEGAMGIVINEPLHDISLEGIMRGADLAVPGKKLPSIYLGGPVETGTAFFLYSSEYRLKQCIEVNGDVCLSSDPQILFDLAKDRGPKLLLPALGYSGWGSGQLENELSVDGWLTLPGSVDVIFNTPDGLKWQKAAELYGIDISLFGDITGSA